MCVVLIAFLLAGCGGSDAAPQHASSASSSPTSHDDEAHEAHAQNTSDTEDDSHADGARTVALGPDRAEALGIHVDALPSGSAASTIRRPASVSFDLDRVARQGPRVEGTVHRVTVDLGEPVEAGQTLAIMSSVELGKAKAAYLTAKTRLKTRRRAYEREQTLYADSISSEAALLEAQAAFEEAQAEWTAARETLRLYGLTQDEVEAEDSHGEPLSHFHVRTPITGVVQRRSVSPGQIVGPQETPFHVADPSEMWVMIDAYERDAPVLQSGQSVTLSVRSQPDRTFEGTVDFVAYQLDEETRTLRVRAVVDNPDGRLRSGMYGQAVLHTDAAVERALVSTDAVQTIHGESVVFVPGSKDGHFRAVPVRTGDESQNGFVEILSGLHPGDRAVTSGAFDLKAALTSSTRSASHNH